MYMCVHMCIMNMHVHCGAYVFSCFTCYLGLTMTESFYLSPILRFSKAYRFYLKALPVKGWWTVIRMRHHTVSWLGFLDWYMYVYMYCQEKRPICVTLWFSVFGERLIGNKILILSIFFQLPFGSDMLLSCIPFMV